MLLKTVRIQWRLGGIHHPQRRIATAASNNNTPSPLQAYKTLNLTTNANRKQIKAAYYSLMKELHPDLNPDRDTTELAAQLNAAYQLLIDTTDSEEENDPLDVFSRPEQSEPTELFVNPFACYGVPLQAWQELQDIARANTEYPEEALRRAGAQISDGACIYLTPGQLKIIEDELEQAALAFDVTAEQAAAYFISDCLLKARVANNRTI